MAFSNRVFSRGSTKWLIAIVGLAGVMCGTEVKAQFAVGPAASAIGEAGRAAVDPGEAALLNPAGVAHLQRYFFSTQYGMSWHPVSGNMNQFGVLLADGSPGTIVPGAFSYVRRRTDPHGGPAVVEQDMQIAVAGFLGSSLAVGVAAHRLLQDIAGGETYEQTNGHVGLLFTPGESFGLSFNAYDVIPASESVPVGLRVTPTLALGTHVLLQEMFRFRLDLVRPDKFNEGHRTNVGAGLETFFREDFAFRLGGLWKETADQTYLTTGFGFRGPRLSFDYTYQRDVRQSEGSRHLFDLWLPL